MQMQMQRREEMGSLLGDWPSYNPSNFTQFRATDQSQPQQRTLTTYHAIHDRATPPTHQVITTESPNILVRQFHKQAEQKLRSKRHAPNSPATEHANKQLKGLSSENGDVYVEEELPTQVSQR